MRADIGQIEQRRSHGWRPHGGRRCEVGGECDVRRGRCHTGERERDRVRAGIAGLEVRPHGRVVGIIVVMIGRLVRMRGWSVVMIFVVVRGVLVDVQPR